MSRKVEVALYLEPDLRDALVARATHEGRTVSALGARLLAHALATGMAALTGGVPTPAPVARVLGVKTGPMQATVPAEDASELKYEPIG